MRKLTLFLCLLAWPAGAATVTEPGSLNVITLDVKTVTTGGTAVNALNPGNAARGGVLVTSNAAGICINLVGTAGTATTGDTVCVAANQPYYVPPMIGSVSVNSSGSAVAIAGYGLN